MRTITVVLTIEDKDAAVEVWDKHLSGELLAGCRVGSIQEGNAIDELAQYQEGNL